MSEVRAYEKALAKRAGFSDLLGFGAIINTNVVLLKDGSLMAVMRFCGEDSASTIDALRMALCERWSQGVCKIWNDNLMIEADLIRRQVSAYSKPQAFPDTISALIDQERRFLFENSGQMYVSDVFFSFTYRQPKAMSARTKKFIFNSDDEIVDKTPAEMISEFENKLTQFVEYVSNGKHNKFMRLRADDLTSFLYSTMTGEHKKLAAPECNLFLDTYMARDDFIPGHTPKLGNRSIEVKSFNELPSHVMAMMFASLNHLPISFRYHIRFDLLSRAGANRVLSRIKRSWSSKAIGIKGVLQESFGSNAKLNEVAEAKRIEAQSAIYENEDGQERYGLFTGSFVLIDEDIDRIKHASDLLIKTANNLGVICIDEKVGATSAYLGSIPGHGEYNMHFVPMDSRAWSMMLPVSGVYAGESHCPCPLYPQGAPPLFYALTDYSNIYRFNNFEQDVGHTMVIGPTGSGKTTLLDMMLMQHRKYPNAREIFIGKDKSGQVAILACGGSFVSLTDQESASINPLHDIGTEFGFELAKSWLIDTFEVNGTSIGALEAQEIISALNRLKATHRDYHKLSNLTFQHKALRDAFLSINQGAFARILGGMSNEIFDSNVLGIELGEIMALKQNIAMPIIQALLMSMSQVFSDGRPTLLILDEAWLLLDHPTFMKKLKDWLKTLRKHNVSVIFASQSLSDVYSSSISDVINESCPTKIFLPNDQAADPSIRAKYEAFDLNEREIDILIGAVAKKHYYVVQPKGRRLIDLALSPIALCFLGASGKDRALFLEHFNPTDDQWLYAYLKARDLPVEANFVKENFIEEAHDA